MLTWIPMESETHLHLFQANEIFWLVFSSSPRTSTLQITHTDVAPNLVKPKALWSLSMMVNKVLISWSKQERLFNDMLRVERLEFFKEQLSFKMEKTALKSEDTSKNLWLTSWLYSNRWSYPIFHSNKTQHVVFAKFRYIWQEYLSHAVHPVICKFNVSVSETLGVI